MNYAKKERYLVTIAIALALLNVGAHLLGSKMFFELPLAEITLALTPISMIALAIVGIKIAQKEE
ncbi:hypothetical protein [Vibrio genomosp. F10]|uniref:hypothetical protein n=1 Tax=Vibrio genomosp. F10 TaxID=723171 RepID=UPI0002D7C617|nr:hypothetical protein [Vibrio genomosp. F10]OEE96384.1 hypothetical protein A1QK_02185 [Vibrio genomosp. F10 str. 9ZD137]